jgi:hypothetical protein
MTSPSLAILATRLSDAELMAYLDAHIEVIRLRLMQRGDPMLKVCAEAVEKVVEMQESTGYAQPSTPCPHGDVETN